jgi:hypothetical protein
LIINKQELFIKSGAPHWLEKATEIASIVVAGLTFVLKIAGLFGGETAETE